ncbi:MAG: SDR family NAD(P)-dependent oxidoreductase, partial [Betaproteobacteria bacterium]
MDESLAGKSVLVTGGARRLGAAIARRLHAAGAAVLIHYRDSEADAVKLEAELNALRPKSAAKVKAELLAPIAARALIGAAMDSFGRLDVLVNNASTFFPV